MGPSDVGRISLETVDSGNIAYDAPENAVKAINTKLDQIIAWQTEVGAAIEAATDGDTLLAALDTASVKTAIQKLKFTL